MQLQRRSVLLGLLATGIGESGCTTLNSMEPQLQEDFQITWDEALITGQPERTAETTVWLDHTTDPERVKQLIGWQKIREKLRWNPDNEERYYSFEPGEKCVVIVVAQHRKTNYTIQGFDQSDGEMFDTGALQLEFVHTDDDSVGDFLYAVSLWGLEDTTVPNTIEPTVEEGSPPQSSRGRSQTDP